MNIEETLTKLKSASTKTLIIGTVILATLITYNASVIDVDSGEKVRIQNSLTGDFEWVQTEGIHFKVPFFSKTARYNDVSTIAITDDEKLLETSSATRAPLSVNFADNYGGIIEASFRAKLPTSPELLEKMHQDVKSQTNLEGNTYLPFAKDMINLTTDQFLAQDFMQGGKGAFKQRLQEQADNGMRVTTRKKIEVKGQVADQTLDGDRSQAATAKQFTYKVISEIDKNGNLQRRPHSLTKYGITIVQIDLGEFQPNPDLASYISTVKQREKESADLIASQKLEREKAVTVQLSGDRKRIEAKNIALMEKDKEVIQGQKQVELAEIQAKREIVEKEKEATLSKIEKEKELAIATAEENIQKANEKAAKYKAEAKLHIGIADAKIIAAKYKAYDKQLYSMEIQRDTMLGVTNNLQGISVTMPNVNISGGTNGTSINSVDTILNAIGVQKLDEIAKTVKDKQ